MAAATERRPPFMLNAISNRLGLFDEDSDYEGPPPEPPKPTTTILTNAEPVKKKAAPKPRKVSAKREESRLKKQESERRKESARLCREAASTLQPRIAPVLPKDELLKKCLKTLPSGPGPSPVARLVCSLPPSVQAARPRLASLTDCKAAGSADRSLRHGGVISLAPTDAPPKSASLPSSTKDFVKHLRKQVDKSRTLLREKEEKFLKEDEEEIEGQEGFELVLEADDADGDGDDPDGDGDGDDPDGSGNDGDGADDGAGQDLQRGESESGPGDGNEGSACPADSGNGDHAEARAESTQETAPAAASEGPQPPKVDPPAAEQHSSSQQTLAHPAQAAFGDSRPRRESASRAAATTQNDSQSAAPPSVSRLNSDSIQGLFPTPVLGTSIAQQSIAPPAPAAASESHGDLHSKRRLFSSQAEETTQSPAQADRATPNLFDGGNSGATGFVPFRGLLDSGSRPHRVLFTYGRSSTATATATQPSQDLAENSCSFPDTDLTARLSLEREGEASQFLDKNGFLYCPPRAAGPASLSQSDPANMELLCSGAFPATVSLGARAAASMPGPSDMLTPSATLCDRQGVASQAIDNWMSQTDSQIEETAQTPRLDVPAAGPDATSDEPTQLLYDGDADADMSEAEHILNASDDEDPQQRDGNEGPSGFLDDEAQVSQDDDNTGDEDDDGEDDADSDIASVLSDVSEVRPLTGLAAARRAQRQLDDDENEASINAMLAQLQRRQKWRGDEDEEDDDAQRARLAAEAEEKAERKRRRQQRRRRRHKKRREQQSQQETQANPEDPSVEVVSEPESSDAEDDRAVLRFQQEEFRLKMERQNSLDTLALLDESSQHIKARIHAAAPPRPTVPPTSPAKGNPALRKDRVKSSFLTRSSDVLARAVVSRGNKSSSAFVFATSREDSQSRSMQESAPRKREPSSSSSSALLRSNSSEVRVSPAASSMLTLSGNKFANSSSALMAALQARRH